MAGLIEAYALVGDCETAALVSRNGSIDWLRLPRFDSDACFASLLGKAENGFWRLAPRGDARVKRQYRKGRLILETEFVTHTGSVTLIDFMPLRKTNPQIVRMIRGDRGSVQGIHNRAVRPRARQYSLAHRSDSTASRRTGRGARCGDPPSRKRSEVTCRTAGPEIELTQSGRCSHRSRWSVLHFSQPGCVCEADRSWIWRVGAIWSRSLRSP